MENSRGGRREKVVGIPGGTPKLRKKRCKKWKFPGGHGKFDGNPTPKFRYFFFLEKPNRSRINPNV